MAGKGKAHLSLRELAVGYHGKVLIGEISLDVSEGEILTLIGPNGAGKSTVLKTITRHLEPVGGRIFLRGRDMREISGRDAAKQMAAVLTDRMRPEYMTCYDIVAAGRYPHTGRLGILTEEDERIVENALAAVKIRDIGNRFFNAISDGQRQRVLLARAICQQPELIVLDEPTSYLDITHKLELLEILRNMARESRITVILSLHEIDLAMRISDRLLGIKDGQIAWQGIPEELAEGDRIAELYDATGENAAYIRELARLGLRGRF